MKMLTPRLVRLALQALLGFLLMVLIVVVMAFTGQQWALDLLFSVLELLFGPSAPGDPI